MGVSRYDLIELMGRRRIPIMRHDSDERDKEREVLHRTKARSQGIGMH